MPAGSTARTAFMRAIETSASPFVAICPPTSPVLPPIGVIATPLLFALLAGGAMGGVSLEAVGKVATLLLVPFALGQLLRTRVLPVVERHKRAAGMTDKLTIVLAVYVAFAQAATEGLWSRIGAVTLIELAGVMAAVLTGAFAAAWGLGAALGLTDADRATLLFAGSHKSLATGAPMARILFPPAVAGAAILPLLLYHQLQLMLSAWIATRLARGTDAEGYKGYDHRRGV